jgi:hypothetical protein
MSSNESAPTDQSIVDQTRTVLVAEGERVLYWFVVRDLKDVVSTPLVHNKHLRTLRLLYLRNLTTEYSAWHKEMMRRI